MPLLPDFDASRRRARGTLRPWVRAARHLLRAEITVEELAYGRMVSMSQFGEDVVLAQLFSDEPTGFYVDVGALDPWNGSNTYALWKRGWRGINIEPQPDQLQAFVAHRPGDVNLCVAVASEPGTGTLVVDGSFSGLDTEQYLWSSGDAKERISVPVRTLASLLEEHIPSGTEIDLLDVDCEGNDGDVLLSNDWTRFRPRVVLAEEHSVTDRADDPSELLVSLGYKAWCRLGPTIVYVDH